MLEMSFNFFFPFVKQDFKVGILQGRTVDMKTLTLIEEPTEEVEEKCEAASSVNFGKCLILSNSILFRSWRRQKMSLKGF